ncbi:uncharacterized protein [Eurosta solidaginis]|uniref:uncharacterized protein n=1 Tax=Eurosta solidaginis TaxID=178769 RepID=UPI003530D96D
MTKNQKAYEHLFGFINSNLLRLEPTSFMTDFELGLRNGIKKIFPDAKLKGCWFHFKQAVRRRAINFEELSKILSKSRDAKTVLNKLMSLPLLDPDNILDGFILCKQEALNNEAFQYDNGNVFDRILEYYERQWLGKITPGQLSLFGENVRTTHEGHNSYLSTKMSKHGSVWEYIKFIRDDELQKYTELKQVLDGALNVFDRPRKKSRNSHNVIDILWQKLNSKKIYVNMFLKTVKNKWNGFLDENLELPICNDEEEKENESEDEVATVAKDILCEVCFTNKKDTIIKPCRHGKICGPCFERMAESHK